MWPSLVRLFLFIMVLQGASAHASAWILNPQDTQVTVYFATGKSTLGSEAKAELNAFVPILSEGTDTIWIYGHCDERGAEDYNQQLSDKRVATVSQYLLKQGILKSRIKGLGYGELQPIGDNSKEQGRALNRRVEVRLGSSPWEALIGKRALVLSGLVKNNTSPLLADIAVSMGDTTLFISSDSTGQYHLPLLSASSYCIYAYVDGYRTVSNCLSIHQMLDRLEEDTLHITSVLATAKVKEKLVLPDIYFENNLPVFLPTSYTALKRLSNILEADPGLIVEIQGHVNYPVYRRSTEETDRFFAWLSFERAHAVYNYCVKMDIEPNRMTYRGLSNKFMVYPNAMTEREMRMNRRVEVLVLE